MIFALDNVLRSLAGVGVCVTEKADISTPGVGPKMAIVVLEHGFGRLIVSGVDTHVHRIANRLGWIKSEKPEGTRRALEALIPREEWKELSVALIGLGQQFCKGRSPRC